MAQPDPERDRADQADSYRLRERWTAAYRDDPPGLEYCARGISASGLRYSGTRASEHAAGKRTGMRAAFNH